MRIQPQHQGQQPAGMGSTTAATLVHGAVNPLPAMEQQHQQHERLLKCQHNLRANQLATPESRGLFEACIDGTHLDKVKRLLVKGGNPNWYNNKEGGQTALHMASKLPGPEGTRVVEVLLAAGAQPGIVNLPEFDTPVHMAAASGNLATVKLLIEWHLANTTPGDAPLLVLQQGNAYGNTPLHEAAIQGHDAIVAYLLDAETAAATSSPSSSVTTIERLKQVDMPNHRGSTPLLFALYGAHPPAALVNRLLLHGADAAHTDHDGVGVLHIAASQGHSASLIHRFLDHFRRRGLDVPALVRARDANGHDPIMYARMKGHRAVEAPLVEAAGQAATGVEGNEEGDEDGGVSS